MFYKYRLIFKILDISGSEIHHCLEVMNYNFTHVVGQNSEITILFITWTPQSTLNYF